MSSTYRRVAPSSFATAIVFCLIAVLLLVSASGCSMKNPHRSGTFERGALFFENGKHFEASEALGAFLRRSPADSNAAAAQLMKAKSYMALKEYPLAAVELRILQQDFPTSEHVLEACYLEGIAYLRQVHNVSTDITGAVEAREHFIRFVELYPGSEYQDEIAGHLQDVSDLVVRKCLSTIHVYWQRHRYESVGIVLDEVLEQEPGSRHVPEVLMERAKVARKMEDTEVARQVLQRLLRDYPESEFIESARQFLAEIEEAVPPAEPES